MVPTVASAIRIGQMAAMLRGARRGPYRGATMPPTSSSRCTRPRCAAVWLEQLEHARVVGARLARERPGDRVRDVEVADAHGVGVAEGAANDLRGGPGTDAGKRPQPGRRFGRGARRIQPRGPRRCAADDLGAPPLDAERVEGVIRQAGQRGRSRREVQIAGSGGGLAVVAQQRRIRPERLGAGHLLLEDRWQQRVEHPAGLRQAQPGVLALETAEDRVNGGECLGPILLADEERRSVEGVLGARTPGGRFEPHRR